MIQGTPAGIRIDGGSHRYLEQQSRQTALERNKPLINRDPTSRAIAFEIILLSQSKNYYWLQKRHNDATRRRCCAELSESPADDLRQTPSEH